MPIRLAYFRTEPISTYIHTTQCWAGLFRGPVCLCPTHNQASQSHRRTPLPSAPAAHPLCANILTIFHHGLPSGVTSRALSADSQSSIRRLVSLPFGALSSLLGCAVLYLGLLSQSRCNAEPVLTTNFHFERNPSLWRASRKS